MRPQGLAGGRGVTLFLPWTHPSPSCPQWWAGRRRGSKATETETERLVAPQETLFTQCPEIPGGRDGPMHSGRQWWEPVAVRPRPRPVQMTTLSSTAGRLSSSLGLWVMLPCLLLLLLLSGTVFDASVVFLLLFSSYYLVIIALIR